MSLLWCLVRCLRLKGKAFSLKTTFDQICLCELTRKKSARYSSRESFNAAWINTLNLCVPLFRFPRSIFDKEMESEDRLHYSRRFYPDCSPILATKPASHLKYSLINAIDTRCRVANDVLSAN